MEYKYSLEKSSKKHICPLCKKRRFVRYTNTLNNEYFDEMFGRCDRETNCGYHKKPSSNNTIYIQSIPIKIEIPTYHKAELVTNSNKKYEANSFILFLSNYFSENDICKTIAKYNIGTSKYWNGATIFWQIDTLDNIHAGKVILFDKYSGKRIKVPFPHINWVHKIIKLKDFSLQQCLFGLQLTKNSLQKPIAIVEAEKTAIIMSLLLPDYIWLATGSKQNLKYDLLKPLINNYITIFPDKGEFDDWKLKSDNLNKLGFKIKCSQLVEKSSFEIGTDLADIYIHKFNLNKKTIEKFDIQYSQAEKSIQKMAKSNPEIWNLISTFDLIDSYGNGIRKI
jgi:hypothetical protein